MTTNGSMLIKNAVVVTMDPQNPLAEAVFVKGGRIFYVGTSVDATQLRDPSTRVIDAGGRTLLPGFTDSHLHMVMGASYMGAADLSAVKNLDDLTTTLRKYADEHPEAAWIECARTPYDILPNRQLLTRQHLDAIIPDRPVALLSFTVHTVWANTKALELGGLLHGRDLGSAGEIVMGADGLALGELREFPAYSPVIKRTDNLGLFIQVQEGKIPDSPRFFELLRAAQKEAARLGLTSVHNMDGDINQMGLYDRLETSGELTTRMFVPLFLMPGANRQDLQQAVEMRATHPGRKVRGGCIKMWLDGEVQSYTGYLLEDYEGKPGMRGPASWEDENLREIVLEADRLGLQVINHTIGDAAVRQALDTFELAAKTNPAWYRRHRMEHLEVIHPDDLPRFAKLGVTASFQPIHETIFNPLSGDSFPERIGRRRWDRTYLSHTLMESGAKVVFGSDWPVADHNPLAGIHAAVNRALWAPGLPDQRFTLHEAICAYTREPAFAEYEEDFKGQLRRGFAADMVLLSEDITAAPPEEIKNAHPVLTVMDGNLTFEA